MSIFGAAATSAFNTAGTRQFFHAITWGLDLAIFTNITHYLVKKCANHPVRGKRPHFKKFAPAYIAGLATCLIMIDLTRHVSNDCWGIWSSEDYSTLWYMMLLTNYSGFTLLFVGVFWGIDFHRKLRLQWRNIKAEREKKKQAREAQVMTQVTPGGRPLMESA